jgi:ribosome-binding protein aMBF1 (putative translation factor)
MKLSTKEKLQAMLGTPPREVIVPEGSSFVEENFEAFSNKLEQLIAVRTVGDGLRQARERRKLTSRQLASQLDLSQSRIMQVERANAQLELRTVAQVAGGLGYQVKLELIPDDASEPTICVVMPRKNAVSNVLSKA